MKSRKKKLEEMIKEKYPKFSGEIEFNDLPSERERKANMYKILLINTFYINFEYFIEWNPPFIEINSPELVFSVNFLLIFCSFRVVCFSRITISRFVCTEQIHNSIRVPSQTMIATATIVCAIIFQPVKMCRSLMRTVKKQELSSKQSFQLWFFIF